MTDDVSYRQILVRRGRPGLLVSAVVSRLAAGMVPFGAVAIFTVEKRPVLAGLAFAAFLLVGSFTGPWRGRLVDRHSARVMLPTLAVPFAGMIVFAALITETAPLVCLAALGVSAALAPPSSAALRTTWTSIAKTPAENRALHSLDSVLEEATFVLSPLLTAAVWALAGPRWAVGLGAVAALVGAVMLLSSARFAGGDLWAEFGRRTAAPTPGPAVRQGAGGLALSRSGLALLAPMFGLGVAMGAVAVVMPVWAGQHAAAELSGVILATISFAGVLAGLIFGAVRSPGTAWAQYGVALVAVAAGTVLIGATGNIAVALIAAFMIGLGMTPMFVIAYILVGEAIAAHRHTEANATLGSAYNLGSGGAAAAAGGLLAATSATITLVTAAAITAATLIAVSQRPRPKSTASADGDRDIQVPARN